MGDVEVLRNALLQASSPNQQERSRAENIINGMERQPTYAQLLIQLVENHCRGTTPQDQQVRTIAGVLFKQLVKKHWAIVVDDDDEERGDAAAAAAATGGGGGGGTQYVLPDNVKDSIKNNMVHLMCIVPPEVQRQLSEALAIISEHDFPFKWPNLLPDLIGKFGNQQDFQSTLGALATTNSILKRFRYNFNSQELLQELKYALDLLAEPLLKLFIGTSSMVPAVQTDQDKLGLVFQALYLIARIFFSLTFQDLPEYFEDHMQEWMEGFLVYMAYENPLLIDPNEDLEPDPISKLQAAIVENVSLFASKYEEEFQPHLGPFTQAIWSLLLKVGPLRKQDVLATTCIRFLTAIVSKQLHQELFADENTLRQITENIVIPNISIREADEELFEDNPTDYIQRDMEGSDSDTRRRCAVDLIRGMCKHYLEATTRVCSDYISKLLTQYATDRDANWKAKDAALQLLLAVAIKAQSVIGGVSQTNEYMSINDIFISHVLPEISEANDVNTRPVVKADCVKFIATFRNQFSLEQLQAIMPLIINHLRSQSVVVQTYSAMAIERILMIKEPRPPAVPGIQRPPPISRFGRQHLQPFLQPLFTNLFGVLDNTQQGGAENEYVMKSIMRSLSIAQEDVLPVSQVVLAKLTQYLGQVCKNPTNPQFNHYLFESIAVLVSKVCQADQTTIDSFEASLFPPFQQVLSMDVIEFSPYVFQILAQLLELRPGKFTPAYVALFPPLLSPVLWERKGNVPALVRLMEAYLLKDASALCAAGHLPGILGVFQKLLSSKANEVYATQLLCAVVERLTPAQLEPYLKQLFTMLLMRLQSHKTARYVRVLTHFFSLFAARHGPELLQKCLDEVQPGMLVMILNQVWLPELPKPQAGLISPSEHKVFVIGMTRLLCECSTVTRDPELWKRLFGAIMLLEFPLPPNKDDKGQVGDDEAAARFLGQGIDDDEDEVSYNSAFSKLHFAKTSILSLLADMSNEKQFITQSLGTLTATEPLRYTPLMQQATGAQQLQALHALCSSMGVRLA